jgi:predicted acyl esterase
MPDVEYAFLADAAEVQAGSKFHVLGGGVSHLAGPSFPFVHPHLALVVGLRVTSVERNREHELGFVVVSPDGAEIASATGKVTSHGPSDASDVVLTIAIDLWNMTLRMAGEHSVRISIGGSERKRLPLVVSGGREAPSREARSSEPPRYLD